MPNSRWVAYRLIEEDPSIISRFDKPELLDLARRVHIEIGENSTISSPKRSMRMPIVSARRSSCRPTPRAVCHSTCGWIGSSPAACGASPLCSLLLGGVFWLTIIGSNYPSSLLSNVLVGTLHPFLKTTLAGWGSPWWLTGFLIDGVYLSTVWVVSVMLPPMAIFFPLFTLLEDFGYLPRVAFNLDELFRRSGAHGKQALTMSMGFGCNAAGVVSTRIIDSERERLIAIITNNFSLCNGRWPTQILLASLFIGAAVPTAYAGLASIGAVLTIVLLGIGVMFASSWVLSHTVLRGEVSTFHLELPPYRPPQFWRTLYTSVIDRTLIVLWRALVFPLLLEPSSG